MHQYLSVWHPSQWQTDSQGCVAPAGEGGSGGWAAALARAEGRIALAGALGLRRSDDLAASNSIDSKGWVECTHSLMAAPRGQTALGARFNAVDVWLAPTALSLASLDVDADWDPLLCPAAHWAVQLYDRRTGEELCTLSDCPRALSNFVTEWLVEIKANLAITQILKGVGGLFSPETLVVPFSVQSLPPQYAALLGDGGGDLWVLKHDGTSGGDGVIIVDSVASAEAAMTRCRRQLTADQQVLGSHGSADTFHFVLQRYIMDPLLLNGGFKFGMRAYTLSCSGKTFLYDEFFIKMAGRPYDTADIKERKIHLTHFGVTHTHLQASTASEIASQLRMPGVDSNDEAGQLLALHEQVRAHLASPLQSVRPFVFSFLLLQSVMPRYVLWQQVRRTISTAVGCGELSERSKGIEGEFVILGWDLIVDVSGKVWVCEGQRGAGCVSRQDHRCFTQRYLLSEYAIPRQAVLAVLGQTAAFASKGLADLGQAGHGHALSNPLGAADTQGRPLPKFVHLPAAEELIGEQAPCTLPAAAISDPLFQPDTRVQVIQVAFRHCLRIASHCNLMRWALRMNAHPVWSKTN